jgi:hypothetical protein
VLAVGSIAGLGIGPAGQVAFLLVRPFRASRLLPSATARQMSPGLD